MVLFSAELFLLFISCHSTHPPFCPSVCKSAITSFWMLWQFYCKCISIVISFHIFTWSYTFNFRYSYNSVWCNISLYQEGFIVDIYIELLPLQNVITFCTFRSTSRPNLHLFALNTVTTKVLVVCIGSSHTWLHNIIGCLIIKAPWLDISNQQPNSFQNHQQRVIICSLAPYHHPHWSGLPPYFILFRPTGLPQTWLGFYLENKLIEFWITSHPSDHSRGYCADMLPFFFLH